jgi:ribosomal protein S18 acetylase RimI-like enzyme
MPITILPFTPERATYFDHLNRAWIEELFTIEPKDDALLKNPQAEIIDHGGEVWFAALGEEIVGACALIRESETVLEFSKLGVAPAARGQGVARALLRHCIARTRERGVPCLRIYTNSKLAPANALYLSEGFQLAEMSETQRRYYQRVDTMYDLMVG